MDYRDTIAKLHARRAQREAHGRSFGSKLAIWFIPMVLISALLQLPSRILGIGVVRGNKEDSR